MLAGVPRRPVAAVAADIDTTVLVWTIAKDLKEKRE